MFYPELHVFSHCTCQETAPQGKCKLISAALSNFAQQLITYLFLLIVFSLCGIKMRRIQNKRKNSHFGNQYSGSSNNWVLVYHKTEQYLSWVYSQKILHPSTFTVILFIISRHWKQPILIKNKAKGVHFQNVVQPTVRRNYIMKFAGKLLKLQRNKNNPWRGNPDQKDTRHADIYKWKLTVK